jgi:indole-3-glycerol phosphate synthase
VPDILDQIVAYKREFLEHTRRQRTLADVRARLTEKTGAPASFENAIRRETNAPLNVIAEVKKASPSKGIIREDFEPVRIAESYAEHGASAISVLTDEEFFKGSLDFLRAINRALPQVPLLRKDFTIDEYQVYEAREAGASAVLLIAAILDKHQLTDYRLVAADLGMGALVEVHSEREADLVAESGAKIIGINNRNLKTFEVDIAQTERVMKLLGAPLPGYIFIGESGIHTPADADQAKAYGVDAILVGESLMKQKEPGAGIPALRGLES